MVDKDKLRIIREVNNYDVRKLSRKLKVSKRLITDWESGLQEIDEENLEKICKLFNVNNYTVTLEKNNVSKVEIDMEISLGGFGQTVSMSYSMIFNISKIGETQVTVPSIVNE